MKSLAERLAAHRPNLVMAALGSLWPFVAGLAFAYLMQVVIAPAAGDFQGKLLIDIGIAIVLAVSLNLVNGFAGQFSLGHAGFLLVGGYVAAWIVYHVSVRVWDTHEIHGAFLGTGELLMVGACVVGGAVAALAGLFVGLPSLRLRGDYLAIVTLGFGEIVRVLMTLSEPVEWDHAKVKESSWFALLDNFGGAQGFDRGITYVDPQNPFWVWVFVALVLIVAYRLKSSSKGRALLAVRENEIAAESIGINTTRAKVSAFTLSAFFAGIGGGLFAHAVGTLKPSELGFQKSIDIVIMVVLGGMGSITGVVIAAIALTILPELFREFAQYRMVVYALALILMMILRPQGLMGIRELWDLGPFRKIFPQRDRVGKKS